MLTIVDCTLRDGGYYTNWDFPKKVVNEYLFAMAEIGVQIVEIGFRGFDKKQGFKGASAYSTDEYISSLNIPNGLKIGVMVNASEIIGHLPSIDVAVSALFKKSDQSPVDLVRVACHSYELIQSIEICQLLKQLGYRVGLNLMQITGLSPNEITALVSNVKFDDVDVFYFADSLGSLTPNQIPEVVEAIKQQWKGNIGIHAHDNMGQALSNSLAAIQNGVTWADCTVSGMGRGPGNTATEYLVLEIVGKPGTSRNLVPLFNLLGTYFNPLKAQSGWGTNSFYYLAGKYGIHPTYIQEMLSDSRYEVSDILSVLERLRGDSANKFDLNELEGSASYIGLNSQGTWEPKNILTGREILIIGTGPGTLAHKEGIETFIKKRNPYVITLNTNSDINEKLINLRAGCHPVRVLADVSQHVRLPQPLAVPISTLPEGVAEAFQNKDIYDFGVAVKPGQFVFHSSYAEIPNLLALSYALAIATSGKASRVFLAGFDGHQLGDPRNDEVEATLDDYLHSPDALEVISITPTIFGITQASVYSF